MSKRANYWKISIIAACLLIVNGALLYSGRFYNSGFLFYLRVPSYIEVVELNSVASDYEVFRSFPYAPYYVSTLSLALGLRVLDVLYVPVIPIIGFVFYLYTTRQLFDNLYHQILLSFGTFLFHFGTVLHYTEYLIGTALYLVAATTIYKYFAASDVRLGLISMLLFIGVKMFNPHAEVWLLTFAVLLIVTPHLLGLNILKKQRTQENLVFLIALLVISLFYNQKLYGQLIGPLITDRREFMFRDQTIEFLSTILPGLQLGPETSKPLKPFVTRGFTSPELQIFEAAYILYVFVGIIFSVFVYVYLHNSNYNFKFSDLFAISLVFSFLPDTLLIFSFGNTSYNIVRVAGPVLFVHAIIVISSQTETQELLRPNVVNSYASIVIVILLSLALFSQAIFFASDVPDELIEEDTTQSAVEFTQKGNYNEVLTGYDEFGLMRTAYADEQRKLPYSHAQFTSEKYGYLISESNSSVTFDMIIVSSNMRNSSFNGDGSWREFEALDKYHRDIASNQKVNNIYDSGEYEIYNT